MNIRNVSAWFIIITLVIVLLIFGQPILVPFVIAMLIWFVIKKLRNLMDRIQFIHRYIPRWIKTIIASLFVFYLIFIVIQVLTVNIQQLSESYPLYVSNVDNIAHKLNEFLEIDVKHELTSFVNDFDFTQLLQSLFNSLSETLSNMVMIVFYVVFMIVEESFFLTKVKLMFKDEAKYTDTIETLNLVDRSMSRYISLKSLVNLISASLSYILLSLVGIDTPIFWAFLIFLFSFIPSVGPILGTLLPSLFSLLQFGEFIPFLGILFGVGAIVMLIGSLVEPRLMGNTLNISPLVAILALAVWGTLWGITGMLLSVPITVAMIILLSHFPSTRPVAILLSEKGRV